MKAQKISQYNIDGTFIKTFNSLNEAMRSVPGTTSLGNVFHLHKDGYFAGGFYWKAEGEDQSLVIPENEYFDSNKQKRVNQYSENGEYIRTFDSIIEIRQSFDHANSIYNSLATHKNGCYCVGYYWRYDTGDHSDLSSEELSAIKFGNKRKVNQYSPEGKYIRTFDSVTDASRQVPGTSSLREFIRDTNKTRLCGGYLWKYDDGDTSDIEPYSGATVIRNGIITALNRKPVLQIDKKTGEIMAEYACAEYAEEATGIDSRHIKNVCGSKRNLSAGGFKWKYK